MTPFASSLRSRRHRGSAVAAPAPCYGEAATKQGSVGRP
jgi:hypothetical protein